MRASLDKILLFKMLTRAGWVSSAQYYLHWATHVVTDQSVTVSLSEEWALSRHLSRQCALASSWTGNGLHNRPALVESSIVDFTELSKSYAASHQVDGLLFSTSVCGQFLCVARDTSVFVYDIRSGHLKPMTSVTCPRRVDSLSMDVSAGRHALAALLEGRMGMVCELHYGCRAESQSLVDVCIKSNMTKTPTLWSDSSIPEENLESSHRMSAQKTRNTSFAQERSFESFNAVNLRSNRQNFHIRDTDDARTYDQSLINDTWNIRLHGPRAKSDATCYRAVNCNQSIPLEIGSSTFYRHLCSEDDPPRSVSICPERRCVAFGCSAGVELHWIDALTGQSLSRWFPLSAPSDFCYFLSPRPGFESAKKLRLISSAAHPDNRASTSRKFFGRPTMNSLWGSLGFESNSRRCGSIDCDHYHAVPLSDGHHVLFIDPSTNVLVLGCDAPLGGSTKLLRKVAFVAPEGHVVPRLYNIAADMSQGTFAVVLYDDMIMLYSIPADVCNFSRLEQTAEGLDSDTAPTCSNEARTFNHWLN